MASKTDNGLASTLAAIERARKAPRAAIAPVLVQSGNELAGLMRQLAPDDPATDAPDLKSSIAVTAPGETTPKYSIPGGPRIAGATEVIITVGNTDVRYPHLQEYGTSKMEAQPFFWPALRLLRKRLENRIKRAARKAVKDAWNAR